MAEGTSMNGEGFTSYNAAAEDPVNRSEAPSEVVADVMMAEVQLTELRNEHGWDIFELRKLKAGLYKFGFNLKRLEGLIKTKTKEQIVEYINVLRGQNEGEGESGLEEEDQEEFSVDGQMEVPEGFEKWIAIVDQIRTAYVEKTGGHGDLSSQLSHVLKQLAEQSKKQHHEMKFTYPRQGGETTFHISEIYEYLAWICQDPDKRGPPIEISPFANAIISRLIEHLEEEVADSEAPGLDLWMEALEGQIKQGNLQLSIPSSNSAKNNYLDYLSLNPLLIPINVLQQSIQSRVVPTSLSGMGNESESGGQPTVRKLLKEEIGDEEPVEDVIVDVD